MYLPAIAVLTFLHFYVFVKGMKDNAESPESSWVFPMAALFTAILINAPFVVSILQAIHGSRQFSGGQHNVTVWLSLIGGAGALALALIQVRALAKRKQWPGASGILRLFARTVLSWVVIIAAYQHLQFVDEDNTGVVAIGLFEDGFDDMSCDSHQVLINWNQTANEPVNYRCPTSVMFNSLTGTPFIPWPDYTEGRSWELTDALLELINSAQAPEDTVSR